METLNSKLTTIATKIRGLTSKTESLSLDGMNTELTAANQQKQNLITALQGFGVDIQDTASLEEAVQKTSALQVGGSDGDSMDAFWESFQQGGNRTRYSYAFAYGWSDEVFNPKYVITPEETYTNQMFEGTGITTVDETKVDFSQCQAMAGAFRNSNIQNVTAIIPNVTNLNQTFLGCANLTDLTLVMLNEECSFSNTFRNCSNLTNLGMYNCTIGKNGFDVSYCTKLTAQTISDHILWSLADKSNDTSGTSWVCTLGTTNLNKLSNEQKAIATQKGWTLA